MTTLAEKDTRFVWHPFTQMQEWTEPLVIERAEGNFLIDTDGRRYLDGVSSLWCNVHGHRHPALDAAIRAQLDRVAHSTLLGLANVPSIELAERLIAVAPRGLTKVFYSDSGSTAVEVALKMAFQAQQQRGERQRTRFLALREAYHGDTIGSVSVGGMDLFHAIFRPLLFDALHIPPTLEALEEAFAAHGSALAAFVVEPLVQGAAGMLLQPPGFLRRARELCTRHGVLLICDEVATGFGRTGTLFACEQEEVAPDLLCLAKGITGGYLPLAATLTTDEVFRAFLAPYGEKRTFFHGHTYTGNPLACAVACASLDLFASDRVLDRVNARAAQLAQLLASEIAPLAHVGEIRQRGLMIGIELVRDRATATPYAYEEAIGARVCADIRRRGVILRPLGPVVVLMPPLSITADEVVHLVAATRAGIEAVCRS
jgi:adenosylmethionine-8-amino-7-oxononanoate aminotransferase